MKNAIMLLLTLLLCATFLPVSAEGADLPLIEGSSFQMGSPKGEPWRSADETAHSVTVGCFYLSPYEVTQAEYEGLMGSNPSTFIGANRPVEGVS